MKVLITGASGFAGTWLARELEGHGHQARAFPSHDRIDLTDADAVESVIRAASPDAVAHLAAVAFGPDAARDPALALQVNVGGTIALCEALRRLAVPPLLLVAGSSDAYGYPDPSDLPLSESAPLRPRSTYGLSKAAQEAVALAAASRHDLRVVVVRSFNHSGPGQREVFVLPALARRVVDLQRGIADVIPVGNLDVRRDFTDVRDIVRAYRLLLEAGAAGRTAARGAVFNVASGRSVAIRRLLQELCELAGVEPQMAVDPALVRPDDPPEILGDASALREATGWRPVITRRQTLSDLLAHAALMVR